MPFQRSDSALLRPITENLRVSTSEAIAASFKGMRLTENSNSMSNALGDKFDGVKTSLEEVYGIPMDEIEGLAGVEPGRHFGRNDPQTYRAVIDYAKNEHPDKFGNVLGYYDLRAEAFQETREKALYYRDIQERGGFGASLVGGFAGAMTDPINIPALILGAPARMGMLAFSLINGAINTGIEAAILPSVAEFRKKIGLPMTGSEVAMRLGFAGAAGFVLSGAIKGTAAGVGLQRAINKDFASLKGMSKKEFMGLWRKYAKDPSAAERSMAMQVDHARAYESAARGKKNQRGVFHRYQKAMDDLERGKTNEPEYQPVEKTPLEQAADVPPQKKVGADIEAPEPAKPIGEGEPFKLIDGEETYVLSRLYGRNEPIAAVNTRTGGVVNFRNAKDFEAKTGQKIDHKLLNEAAKSRPKRRRVTALDDFRAYAKERGGINLEEAKNQGLFTTHKEMISMFGPGTFKKGGVGLDNVRERFEEMGYFAGREGDNDIGDLLDLIQNEPHRVSPEDDLDFDLDDYREVQEAMIARADEGEEVGALVKDEPKAEAITEKDLKPLRSKMASQITEEELKEIDRGYVNADVTDLAETDISTRALVPVDRPIKVWRGQTAEAGTMDGYWISASPSRETGENFGRMGDTQTVMEINIRPGVKVIVPDSGIKGGELVIGPNTKYTIKSRGPYKGKDNVDHVVVEATVDTPARPRDADTHIGGMFDRNAIKQTDLEDLQGQPRTLDDLEEIPFEDYKAQREADVERYGEGTTKTMEEQAWADVRETIPDDFEIPVGREFLEGAEEASPVLVTAKELFDDIEEGGSALDALSVCMKK